MACISAPGACQSPVTPPAGSLRWPRSGQELEAAGPPQPCRAPALPYPPPSGGQNPVTAAGPRTPTAWFGLSPAPERCSPRPPAADPPLRHWAPCTPSPARPTPAYSHRAWKGGGPRARPQTAEPQPAASAPRPPAPPCSPRRRNVGPPLVQRPHRHRHCSLQRKRGAGPAQEWRGAGGGGTLIGRSIDWGRTHHETRPPRRVVGLVRGAGRSGRGGVGGVVFCRWAW